MFLEHLDEGMEKYGEEKKQQTWSTPRWQDDTNFLLNMELNFIFNRKLRSHLGKTMFAA
jgi:hypothetical protein